MKLAAMIALIGFFIKALRLALKADVICSHWLLPSGLIGAVLSRMLDKPHVAIEHSGALHLLMNVRGGTWLARFIVAGSRRMVVVSDDLRRKLIGLYPEAHKKCAVIPMGVMIQRSSPVAQANSLRYSDARPYEQAEPSILFIGRLIEIKGVDVLLEALREISGARLVIAGDGPERSQLERLATRLSIDAEFIGQIDAATRDALLASCKVAVIPSRVLDDQRSEGVPVVCLEAMAAGCAIIAARTGGLAEIIRDPHNGLLFEPGDARMLADKLQLLLNDAALRDRLGQNARRAAMDYAWPRVAERFTRLIHDSLNDAIDKDTSRDAERAAC